MQPQPIPQVQIPPQNMQIPVANQPNQPQFYQIVQMESQNSCEKLSKFLTGNANIPLMVFLILMGSFLHMILSILFAGHYLGGYFISSSFFNLLFALFVWCKMSMKIESNTSTVKYAYLFFINLLVLSLVTITFPLCRIWNFVLFETILIALNNKDKRIKFFCCRISGRLVIIFSVIYHLFFNWLGIFSLIVTIVYALVYNKYLSQKLNVSNEKAERLENMCFFNYLKNNFKTFISVQDVLNKEKREQPLVQDINNSVNMSFIPANMYPNYYSGIIPNPNQPQIPQQPLAPAPGAINPPVVNINQAN